MKWLRLALPAGAILISALLWLAATPASAVEDNVVAIEPGRILVAPDGDFVVHVRTDPPEQTLAIWIIEVKFDPAVITAESRDCNPLDPPGGSTGVADCQVVDTDGDGADDTAKILGGVLFNDDGAGLSNTVSLADITFHVVGGAAECSDLRVRNVVYTDPDAVETGALVQDGRVCVEGEAPANGTEDPTIVPPRTSEPTAVGGETLPPIPSQTNGIGGDTGSGGNETLPPGVTSSPSRTLAPGETLAPTESSGPDTNGSMASPTSAPGDITDEDDGTSPVIWVILGLAVLGLAAGGAWAVVRLRKPPVTPTDL